jgi:hypothetical protein
MPVVGLNLYSKLGYNGLCGLGCGTWCPELERSTAAVSAAWRKRLQPSPQSRRRGTTFFAMVLLIVKRRATGGSRRRRSRASHFGGKGQWVVTLPKVGSRVVVTLPENLPKRASSRAWPDYLMVGALSVSSGLSPRPTRKQISALTCRCIG